MWSDQAEPSASHPYKPSFVLIAIDTHPSMFVAKQNETNGNSCPFKDSLKACYDIAESLILTKNQRAWCPFAVVLAADEPKANLIEFDANLIDSIKLLKRESTLSVDELRDNYMRCDTTIRFDLSAFLLLCKKKFKDIKSQFYKRTIIYITQDDDPVGQDDQVKFVALNEARNFEANDIVFELITMNETFNYNIFYNEMFALLKSPLQQKNNVNVEILIQDEDGLKAKLSASILLKFYQRKLCFYPLIGDATRYIKVIQKNYIVSSKLYNNAYITNDTNKLVKKVSKTDDTSNCFTNTTYTIRCGLYNDVVFDHQEMSEIKNNERLPIGYTLIYVGNRQTPVGYIATKSYLLECNPKEDLSLSDFYLNLWQYCRDKNKVLVCARKLRYNDKIRFVEFIPKCCVNDDDTTTTKQRIFLIKTIPTGEEVSYPSSVLTDVNDDEYPTMVQNAEKIELTAHVIDELSFEYYPKMLANPAYARKQAYIKAKLLDEPIEIVEDVTKDQDGIDTRMSAIADEFVNLFHLSGDEAAKRKRSGRGSTVGATAKKRGQNAV